MVIVTHLLILQIFEHGIRALVTSNVCQCLVLAMQEFQSTIHLNLVNPDIIS